MAENTYYDRMKELSLAIQGMMRGIAITKVRDIAETCSNYKIGKTGETLAGRLTQPDYLNTYSHIKEIYSSKDARDVSEMETILIRQFINDYKCDNIKDGYASLLDPMKEDSEKYSVYVVWND